MSASETKTTAEILRGQFAPNQVGKLPRVTCGDCSDRRKNCAEHRKARCDVCRAWVSTKHIHIDYVGHADVTSRLLEADPEWTWEPQARDVDPAVMAAAVASGNPEVVRIVLESAPPKFDLDDQRNPVGLWINLTVGGGTRPGYGSVPSGQDDAVKVLIGDALRNAAMRFGVALDLWAKGERADPAAENATASGGQVSRGSSRQGESFDSASPRAAASRNGRQDGSPANGHAARPAAAGKPAVVPSGEIDKDAQALADEAHEARTIPALKAIYERGVEDAKGGARVTDPATGEVGVFSKYIAHRRDQLEEADAALDVLVKAAEDMAGADLEAHVQQVTGAGIESATAAQLRQATAALTPKAA